MMVQQAELGVAAAQYPEAAATAERAREAYIGLDDERAALRATALLGRIEMQRGHWDEAGALLQRSLDTLDPATDPAAYARIAAEFARTRMIRDRNDEGAAWAAEALNTRGACLEGLGLPDEGIALIRASVEPAAAHLLSSAELRARYNLAGQLDHDDPRGSVEPSTSAPAHAPASIASTRPSGGRPVQPGPP